MTTDHPTPPAYGPGSVYADMEARMSALEDAAEKAATPAERDALFEKSDAVNEEMREYRRTYPKPPSIGFDLRVRLINVPEGLEGVIGATVPLVAESLLDAFRSNLPTDRWEASYVEVTA